MSCSLFSYLSLLLIDIKSSQPLKGSNCSPFVKQYIYKRCYARSGVNNSFFQLIHVISQFGNFVTLFLYFNGSSVDVMHDLFLSSVVITLIVGRAPRQPELFLSVYFHSSLSAISIVLSIICFCNLVIEIVYVIYLPYLKV